MRAPFVPTDPVKAKQIALHTEEVLRLIRDCHALNQLDRIVDGYMAFADEMSVVKPIREHVTVAAGEVQTLLKAREANAKVVRDPTGENNQ